MQTHEFGYTVEIYRQLLRISKTLHKLDENACNYELSKSQVTRGKNLMIKAEALAQEIGLHAYNQSDPRGCSLYLVKSLKNANSNYSSGTAIYQAFDVACYFGKDKSGYNERIKLWHIKTKKTKQKIKEFTI